MSIGEKRKKKRRFLIPPPLMSRLSFMLVINAIYFVNNYKAVKAEVQLLILTSIMI